MTKPRHRNFRMTQDDAPFVAQLKPSYRQILAFNGLGYQAAMTGLDLKQGTVKSRLHRARTALQELREKSQ